MIDLESPGVARLTKAKQAIDGALAFYHLVGKANIPAIVAIGDAADVAAERFFPPLNRDELKMWKTRATSIERVNKVLADFETDVIHNVTVSNAAIFVRQSWKVVKTYAIIIGHLGELTLIVAAALAIAKVQYGDSFWQALKNAAKAATSASFPNYLIAQKKLNEQLMAIARYIVQAAVLGMVALIVDSLMAGYSVAKWAEHTAPVLKARDVAIQRLKHSAFPQRTGRVRRKKRSRKN